MFSTTNNSIQNFDKDMDDDSNDNNEDKLMLTNLDVQNIQENSYTLLIEIDETYHMIYTIPFEKTSGHLNRILKTRQDFDIKQISQYNKDIQNNETVMNSLYFNNKQDHYFYHHFTRKILSLIVQYSCVSTFTIEKIIKAMLEFRMSKEGTPNEVYCLRLIHMFTTFIPKFNIFMFHSNRKYCSTRVIYEELTSKFRLEKAEELYERWISIATVVYSLDLHKVMLLIYSGVLLATTNVDIYKVLSIYKDPIIACTKLYKIDYILKDIIEFYEDTWHKNLFNYNDNFLEDHIYRVVANASIEKF